MVDLENDTSTILDQCLFMPENAGYFVNYVIASALVGLAQGQLRLSDLISFAKKMFLIKSKAEKVQIKRDTISEFDYVSGYVNLLIMFSIISIYIE